MDDSGIYLNQDKFGKSADITSEGRSELQLFPSLPPGGAADFSL